MSKAQEQETVGQRIKRLREAAALTQRALAGPGLSYAYISLIERDLRRPSVRALRLLAGKLGTTPDYLETGVDLSEREMRELRLSEAELQLRLSDDVDKAEQELEKLLEEATQAGDLRAATRARVGLGLAAAHHGAHGKAIELLEAVVGQQGITPASHPDVYFTLGHSYVTTTQIDKAIDLWRDSLTSLEQGKPANSTAYVRFATYLSYALSDRGDLAGAQQAIEDALTQAGDEADPYTKIRLHWSQARLALTEGHYRDAQGKMRRAIALLEATEDTFYLARGHLLYAEMLLASGDLQEVDQHLDAAERLFGRKAEAQDLAWLAIERGKLAARRGQGAQAVILGQKALQILGDDDPGFRGRAHWAIAEGLAASGDHEAAFGHFSQAEELLVNENRVSIQVLEAWGKALHSAGEPAKAYEVMARAVERGRIQVEQPSA